MIILPGCLTVFVLSFFSTEIFHFPEAMLTFFIQLVEKFNLHFRQDSASDYCNREAKHRYISANHYNYHHRLQPVAKEKSFL